MTNIKDQEMMEKLLQEIKQQASQMQVDRLEVDPNRREQILENLRGAGYQTFGDIMAASHTRLIKVPDVGAKSAQAFHRQCYGWLTEELSAMAEKSGVDPTPDAEQVWAMLSPAQIVPENAVVSPLPEQEVTPVGKAESPERGKEAQAGAVTPEELLVEAEQPSQQQVRPETPEEPLDAIEKYLQEALASYMEAEKPRKKRHKTTRERLGERKWKQAKKQAKARARRTAQDRAQRRTYFRGSVEDLTQRFLTYLLAGLPGLESETSAELERRLLEFARDLTGLEVTPETQPGPTGCILGTVLLLTPDQGARVQGLEGIQVKLTATGDAQELEETTGPNGEFCFEGLEVDQDYTLIFPEASGKLVSFRLVEVSTNGVTLPTENGDRVVVSVVQTGDCEQGPCTEVTAYYEAVMSLDSVLGTGGELLEKIKQYWQFIPNRLDDMIDYPVAAAPVSPGATPAAAGTDLQELVRRTVAEALGSPIPPKDVQLLQRALEQRIRRVEIDDDVTYNIVEGPTVIGPMVGSAKLTGDQARLQQQADSCLEQTRVILGKMAPLDQDVSERWANVRKDSVLDLLTTVAAELGRSNNPRKILVDTALDSLLFHPIAIRRNGDQVTAAGELQALDHALGYRTVNNQWVQVFDLNDEEHLTHSQMVRDHVYNLYATWQQSQGQKPKPPEVSPPLILGTNVRALARDLASVTESLEEVQAMLISVRCGPAEQATVEATEGVMLGELLETVQQFVTGTAREAAESGNTLKIEALLTLTVELKDLVQATSKLHTAPFNRRRVKLSLRELAAGLGRVESSVLKISSLPADEPGYAV